MKKAVILLISCIFIINICGQNKNAVPVVSSKSKVPIKINIIGADTLTHIPSVEYPPELEIEGLSYSNTEHNDFICADVKGCLSFKIKNTGQGDAYNLRLYVSKKDNNEGIKYDEYKFIKQQIKTGETYTDSIYIEGQNNLQEGMVEFELLLCEANGYKSRPATISLYTREASKYDIDILNYDISDINERELGIQMTVKNTGSTTLKDAKVIVNFPPTVYVKGDNVKTLQMLKPDESEELNYIFVKNLIHTESRKDIFRINLEDSKGRQIGKQREISRITKERPYIAQSDVDIDIPRSISEIQNTHIYALIIGNEKYTGIQEVPNAENDARIFSIYCARTFNIPAENISLLTNATGNQMKDGLRTLARKAAYNKSGKVELIIYYSGHGIMAKDKHEKDDNALDQYLLPVDVSGPDATASLSRKDIYLALNDVPFNKASIFLDACNIPIDRAIIKTAKHEWKGNVFVFASSSPSQSSITFMEKKHGLFTYFLLKNIQDKKGKINYKDLTDNVIENVQLQSDIISNKKQIPEIIVSPQTGEAWKKWKIPD